MLIAWITDPTKLSAVATIIIAFFTGTLFFATRGQLKQLKRSVDISERSLTDLEGPFIYPTITSNNIQDTFQNFRLYDHPSSPHEPVSPNVIFALKNHGRSPALIQSIIASFFVGHADDAFTEKGDLAGLALLGPGESSDRMGIGITHRIDKVAYDNPKKTARIFLRGTVVFHDVFGNGYIQAFCLGWDIKTGRFSAWGAQRNVRRRFDPKESPTG